MTFMTAWPLGRAHFKETISRFHRKRCWPAGGRHAVGPMAFPNHPWTEAGMKKLFCVPILWVALLLALGPACPVLRPGTSDWKCSPGGPRGERRWPLRLSLRFTSIRIPKSRSSTPPLPEAAVQRRGPRYKPAWRRVTHPTPGRFIRVTNSSGSTSRRAIAFPSPSSTRVKAGTESCPKACSIRSAREVKSTPYWSGYTGVTSFGTTRRSLRNTASRSVTHSASSSSSRQPEVESRGPGAFSDGRCGSVGNRRAI